MNYAPSHAGDFYALDNTITYNADVDITNRMHALPVISATDVDGELEVARNTLTGHPWSGIDVDKSSAYAGGNPILIHHNNGSVFFRTQRKGFRNAAGA